MKEIQDVIKKYTEKHPDLPKMLKMFGVSQAQYIRSLLSMGKEKNTIKNIGSTSDISFSHDDLSTTK